MSLNLKGRDQLLFGESSFLLFVSDSFTLCAHHQQVV